MYADLNNNSEILKNISFPIYMDLKVLDIGNNKI